MEDSQIQDLLESYSIVLTKDWTHSLMEQNRKSRNTQIGSTEFLYRCKGNFMGNEVFLNMMLKQLEGKTIWKGAEGGEKEKGRKGGREREGTRMGRRKRQEKREKKYITIHTSHHIRKLTPNRS